jgi:uncharacterized membrane protein YfcA
MLVGMTGVGGGSLMTPILVLLFSFHPATAVGTDLLYASVTKTIGTAVHGKQGTVDWSIVTALACGSVPASILTILVMSRVGTLAAHAAGTLNLLLGGALVLTSISVFFRPWILSWAGHHIHALEPARLRIWTVFLGVMLGILVSVTSVGAGALGTTALLILYPRLPVARIAASDIAHAVPLTLVAGAGHWYLGSVDWALLAPLLTGSLPGIAVGSALVGRIPDVAVRTALAVILVVVGARLVL